MPGSLLEAYNYKILSTEFEDEAFERTRFLQMMLMMLALHQYGDQAFRVGDPLVSAWE